jgi:hypothetical protein
LQYILYSESNAASSNSNKEAEIKELESLGVEFLTPEEAQVLIKQKNALKGGIEPQVALPTSSNIVWSSYRANWVKNGVTYANLIPLNFYR